VADNTEPEMPQGPAATSQKVVSPVAEAGKTPEISAPMLDTSTSVQEQQQTLNCVVIMQSRESLFGDQLSVIGNLTGYGPPLGWWQMVPFLHMAEQHDFAKAHPETNAPTIRDQQQAISVLSGSR
jgi:hypothetical protein